MITHNIRNFIAAFILTLAALVSIPVCVAASDESFDVLKGESLGKIKYGEKQKVILKLLGEPKSKGDDVHWEATGEWVQDWSYPDQGIELKMASKKKGGAKTVSIIMGLPACKLATTRGIKIGSSLAEVRKAYGDVEEKSDPPDDDTFVAGSIYGGVIFTLKHKKVVEIFIGAAAE